jgi:hypothetical protein
MKLRILLSLAIPLSICSCTSPSARGYANEKDKSTKKDVAALNANDASKFVSSECDASLWSHVYDPTRLQKLKDCITVTGTVEESNADEDGDQHFLIKLDRGQDQLLTKRNLKKKNGDLVGEIVCANKVKIKKAKAACAGYSNTVQLPTVGNHVSVTGTYVLDSHNGWTEIHPVSKVQ